MSAPSDRKSVAAWLPRLSVGHYLALLALLIAFPLIALALFISDRVATTEREATKAALLSNAWSLADSIDREIDKHVAVGVTLAQSRALLTGDRPGFYARAKAALAILPDSWVLVVDPSGQQLLNTLRPLGEPLPQRALRDTEQRAGETGKPQVSDVFQGLVARRPIALAAIPVFQDGKLLCFVDIGLTAEHFGSMLRQQKYPANWYGGIIDRNGNILASQRDPEGKRTGTPASDSWRAAIRRAAAGTSETQSVTGNALVGAYAPTAHGWTVGVAIDKNALEVPGLHTRWLLAGVGIGCIGLGLLFASVLARPLTRAMASLQSAATAMEAGWPVELEPTGIRECDELNAKFAKTSSLLRARAEERGRAEAALARRVNELSALYAFTQQRFRTASTAEICDAALDAIFLALQCDRAAILMFDGSGKMRFVAWRGLSDDYRKAVDGHSPWSPEVEQPEPVLIEDIAVADLPESLRQTVEAEGIAALAFVPITSDGKLIGKFMTYYSSPHSFAHEEIQISLQIAQRVGFRLEHRRAEESRLNAEQELRDSESRLVAILEQMPLAVGLMNLDGHWILTNSAMNQFIPEVMPSRDPKRLGRWKAYAADGRPLEHAEWPGNRALLGETVSPGTDFTYTVDDGRKLWTRVAAAPFRSPEGRLIGAVTVVQDITALKEAEETGKILTRELQHRTNNLLAVVQAIAHRSLAGHYSLDEARSAFTARLQALARTHHQLTKSNWSGICLRDLLHAELEPFAARTKLDGLDVNLDPQRAQHLSLAMHELATNAVKYGSLSSPEGHVAISWEVKPNLKGKVLNFRWEECGGPIVVSPKRQGFGTALLNSVFGEAHLDYAPEGLRCEFDLPLGPA